MSGGDSAAPPVVETARLRLRAVDERDAPAAARLMTPAVSQWLGFPKYGDEGKVTTTSGGPLTFDQR